MRRLIRRSNWNIIAIVSVGWVSERQRERDGVTAAASTAMDDFQL